MEKDNNKIGIINEIGDLGLGFDPISDEDADKLKEEDKKEER